MRYRILLLLLLCNCVYAYSQTIKVANGIGISKMYSSDIEDIYSSYTYDYSNSLGISYWNHKYFNLSSQIGYITKGGISNTTVWGDGGIISEKIDVKLRYLDLNTLFVAKIPLNKFCVYAGIGPSVNFLFKRSSNLDSKYVLDTPYDVNEGNFNKIGLAIKSELGVAYYWDKLEFGVSVSNLYDLFYLDKLNFNMKSKVFIVMLSIGYVIN